MADIEGLSRIHGGWRYEGVDYFLPLPVNSPVSFAVARTNTEADGLGPSTARHSKANLQVAGKRGRFNYNKKGPARKYPEFDHLTDEQRKNAISGLNWHRRGYIRNGTLEGGQFPDMTPVELLERYGLPMPPGEVRTWQ